MLNSFAAVTVTKRKSSARLGKLSLATPRVVGVVSSMEFDPPHLGGFPCDIVEFRLDQMRGLANWPAICEAIESSGTPVILTIRLKREGGGWRRADKARLPLFEQALEVVSAVDVELQSDIVERVCAMAKKKRKCCIVSSHDFVRTPPLSKLERLVEKSRRLGTVAKIATMTKTKADVETLRSLLALDSKSPVCVMGMGKLGTKTRVEFPKLGSCLTYGYLDKPAAPGQSSAAALLKNLRGTR
jgi:3-dehydroquinate dehydratase-1